MRVQIITATSANVSYRVSWSRRVSEVDSCVFRGLWDTKPSPSHKFTRKLQELQESIANFSVNIFGAKIDSRGPQDMYGEWFPAKKLVCFRLGFWVALHFIALDKIFQDYKNLQEFREVREVGVTNFCKICWWHTMMELQSKFEVISVTDGDFTAQKVRLDGFAPKRCPEMANPFNSEIFSAG